MIRIFSIFIVLIVLTPVSFAYAQESRACGVPDTAAMDTEALYHCDMYQRKLAYREEALKLEALMEERQENFAAPRREALERYEEDMKALNEQRGSEQ